MAGKGKFKKNGMVIAHDEKHTGPEPTWDDAEFLSDEGLQDRMLDALRFYGYYLDRDDFSNFAMAWMVDAGYTPEDDTVTEWWEVSTSDPFGSRNQGARNK